MTPELGEYAEASIGIVACGFLLLRKTDILSALTTKAERCPFGSWMRVKEFTDQMLCILIFVERSTACACNEATYEPQSH